MPVLAHGHEQVLEGHVDAAEEAVGLGVRGDVEVGVVPASVGRGLARLRKEEGARGKTHLPKTKDVRWHATLLHISLGSTG